MGAEAVLEEAGRELVVLLVRLIGGDGDGHAFQLRDVGHQFRLALLRIELFEGSDGVGEAVPDAEADQGVGDFAGGEEVGAVHGGVESAG